MLPKSRVFTPSCTRMLLPTRPGRPASQTPDRTVTLSSCHTTETYATSRKSVSNKRDISSGAPPQNTIASFTFCPAFPLAHKQLTLTSSSVVISRQPAFHQRRRPCTVVSPCYLALHSTPATACTLTTWPRDRSRHSTSSLCWFWRPAVQQGAFLGSCTCLLHAVAHRLLAALHMRSIQCIRALKYLSRTLLLPSG